jgi:hypothetical protein
MFTDDDRRRLYDALEHSLGRDPAAILMAHLPPVGWAELATKGDLALVRGDVAELRGEVAEVRGEVAEVRGEVAEVRGEVAELRGDMKAMLPKLIAANIASMVGVAGLVLAATALH